LTDAEWSLLAPLPPAPSRRGRPRTWGLRSLVNGIFFRIRTGCPWRDVHERYGPWWRIYHLFVRLRADGVWQDVHTRLLAQAQHPALGGAGPSWLRTIPGRVVNEDPRRYRRGLRGDVGGDHPWSGRRWAADGAGTGEDPGAVHRAGSAAETTRAGAGG